MDRVHLPPELGQLRLVLEADQRVVAAFAFGSRVEGYASEASDIDLAVLFEQPLSLMAEAEFLDKLCAAAELENLDLLQLNQAPVAFQFLAVGGILLYERDSERVSDFIERVTLRYLDVRPLLDEFERQYDFAVQEAYGV
jgi:predicted nucleotidyltransferase